MTIPDEESEWETDDESPEQNVKLGMEACDPSASSSSAGVTMYIYIERIYARKTA